MEKIANNETLERIKNETDDLLQTFLPDEYWEDIRIKLTPRVAAKIISERDKAIDEAIEAFRVDEGFRLPEVDRIVSKLEALKSENK